MKKILLFLLFPTLCAFAQETIVTVGTGEYATTYVTASGKVYTTVGNDTAGYSVVAIPGLTNIVQAEGGQYSTVLRGSDGKVYSVNGGTMDVTAYPVDNTGAPFTADYVQGFYKNFLALKNGKIWYWTTPNTGRNKSEDILNQGYVGTAPKLLAGQDDKTFVKVVSASSTEYGEHTFAWALADDGTIWRWDRTKPTPSLVTGYTGTARDIALVGHYAFVVETTDKQLWTWGYYAIYTGGAILSTTPANVTALWAAQGCVLPSKKLQGNYTTLHIIDANNNMFASGCNMQGNVGNGRQHPSWRTYSQPYQWTLKKEEGITGPVQVPGKWKNVISNNTVVFYLYGQDMAGNWYSWGRNKSRALGNGLTMNSSDEASKSEYYNIPAPRLVTPLTQTWTVSGPVDVNANRSPIASAGINQYLPAGTTSTTLYGNGSHQQQPTSATTVTMSNVWTQVGGAAATIVSPSTQNPTVNNLAQGTYVFRNTVWNSNGAIDSQEVTVVVGGPLISITTPTSGANYTTSASSVTVTGTGAASVIQVAWTNSRGGSGTATGTASWSASIPLQQGENILTFTATDNAGNSEVKTLVVNSNPPPPAAATGLAATYYNEKDLSGFSVTRVDPQINFTWGSGSPDPSIAPDTYSARWEGRIQATVSGTYTFTVGSDDGSRLWIGQTLVVDHWSDHGHTLRSGTIVLAAGQKYPIKMEYYENTSSASAELRWKPPGQSESVVVPSSAFTPPPANGLIGTYYDTMNFTGTSFSRVYPTVSFYWVSGSPDPSIANDTFSVRWKGKIVPTTTGVHTFEIGSDDGSRLWVNGTLVATHWSDHGHSVRTGTIALTAGQEYPIVMEYYENTSSASAELKWTPPGGTSSVVPSSVLWAEVDEEPLPPAPPAAPVRYEFGGNDAPTNESGWNNVTNVTVGSGVANSVDTSGTATGIGLTIVQSFAGVNSQGSTGSGIYPSNAIRDSVFVNAGQTGKLQLSGLKATSKYTLTFFASRAASDNVRVTKYTVGTASVTLDAAIGGGNTSTTAVLPGITPGGSGVVEIEVTNNPGSTFGYLGVLEVQEEAAAQSFMASSPAGGAPSLVSAVSRQAHGTAGSFDIALPVTGAPGVECRQLTSGSCTLVLTFDRPIAGGNATLVGVGSVVGSPVVSGSKMTVQLGGVVDGQTMQLNVDSVSTPGGGSSGSASLVFRVLAGDANGDGIVTDADVDLVKARLSPTINAGNAASDVNRNGSLNTADVLFVSGRRGGSAL